MLSRESFIPRPPGPIGGVLSNKKYSRLRNVLTPDPSVARAPLAHPCPSPVASRPRKPRPVPNRPKWGPFGPINPNPKREAGIERFSGETLCPPPLGGNYPRVIRQSTGPRKKFQSPTAHRPKLVPERTPIAKRLENRSRQLRPARFLGPVPPNSPEQTLFFLNLRHPGESVRMISADGPIKHDEPSSGQPTRSPKKINSPPDGPPPPGKPVNLKTPFVGIFSRGRPRTPAVPPFAYPKTDVGKS